MGIEEFSRSLRYYLGSILDTGAIFSKIIPLKYILFYGILK